MLEGFWKIVLVEIVFLNSLPGEVEKKNFQQ